MRLFLGLKYLKIFLLSEEYQKASGTNQISFKGWGKKKKKKHVQQYKQVAEGKEHREKKVAFLFLSLSG